MKRALTTLLALLMVLSLPAGVTLLQTTGRDLTLEYRLDPYKLIEENGFITISMPGMDYPSLSGSPLLPYLESKIGLPPGGQMAWDLQSVEEEHITLKQRLTPAPTMKFVNDMSRSDYLVDEALYAANPDYTTALEAQNWRGFRFAALRITPFRYDGQTRLTILKRAVFSIRIQGDLEYRAQAGIDELMELMLGQFVNGEQAKAWQSFSRNPINYAPFASADQWLKIETDKEGMYKLSYQQLSALPLADIDPRTFRLFSTGGELRPFQVVTPGPEFQELAIRVVGEEDGHFDSGDYILFYGSSRDGTLKNQSLDVVPTSFNPYSQNSVYWLSFGGSFSGPPRRMDTLPQPGSYTKAVHTQLAQSRYETETHRRTQIGFIWYSSRLFGNSTAEYQYTLPLSNLNARGDSLLTIRFRQEEIDSDIWHYINVFVNDIEVAPPSGQTSFSWQGTGEYIFQKYVTSFVNGDNVIRIRVNRNGTDNLFLDFIAVDYPQTLIKGAGQYLITPDPTLISQTVRYTLPGGIGEAEVFRALDYADVSKVPVVSEPDSLWFAASGTNASRFIISTPSEYYSPVSITEVNPVDLTVSPSQVDHVIIAPAEYLTQAQTLADMYADFHGLSVKVVDQQDIITQFNGGHPDPAAIRQYLRYVYHHHPAPRLRGVTLIGLGTFDWRNQSRQSSAKNKLMIYQRGESSSDDFYAMMSSSFYPELIIGRYPVRNTNELNNMLSNYREYNQNPQGGWWRNSMVMLGDDLYNGSLVHYENIHTRQVELAGNVVHPSIQVDKIFAWEYDYDEYQNKPQARDDMLAAVNEGRLVWYYIGHGSFDSLGSEDFFNGATDMGRFNNANHLPLFMAASCKVSQFDHWGFESLGQKVVMLNNLGAIASFSATRLSSPYSNAPMGEKILDNLANKRNYLGYSIMAAKLASQTDDNDHVYVLLGDPTLRIIPPQRDSLMSVSTGIARDGKTTLQSRQKVDVQGSLNPYSGAGTAEIKVFDSAVFYNLDAQSRVSHRGTTLFKGSASVSSGQYEAAFIVPDDITNGDTGSIVSYLWDAQAQQDYVNYHYPVTTSDQAVQAENLSAPAIELFLGSYDFRPGDTVSTSPTLLARISDDNGINLTGSAGHNILLVIDNSIQPIPVTSYFSYDQDSYTSGILRYPISGLSEGPHSVQVVAFDNFNLPSVTSTQFIAKKTGALSIERLLIYPNPIENEGHITFILSEDSDLDIGIYTITGKRLRRIQTPGRQGFNQIPWDGRDHNGNRLANNSYFVKVTAKSGSRTAEARERLVIYK
ncbi:MAG TPA: type IX secretion system sortase PorU [Candidatus Cloacimonadota bacterium]|nr:type IX secretion system sortase PorU [Candidatus Cloacimonadota bacterium]